MLKKIIMVVLVTSSLLVLPQRIVAEQPPIEVKPLSTQDYIVKYAEVYGVSKKQLLQVAFCESSYRQSAIGDGGRANGIFQFHKPTWDSFTKQMGEKLDYYSTHDQAKVAAWAFKNGYASHWTCAKTLGYTT